MNRERNVYKKHVAELLEEFSWTALYQSLNNLRPQWPQELIYFSQKLQEEKEKLEKLPDMKKIFLEKEKLTKNKKWLRKKFPSPENNFVWRCCGKHWFLFEQSPTRFIHYSASIRDTKKRYQKCVYCGYYHNGFNAK